ncbi:hypothetical protein V1511DRAFT_508340 [Dipodascopsis uninucleata]
MSLNSIPGKLLNLVFVVLIVIITRLLFILHNVCTIFLLTPIEVIVACLRPFCPPSVFRDWEITGNGEHESVSQSNFTGTVTSDVIHDESTKDHCLCASCMRARLYKEHRSVSENIIEDDSEKFSRSQLPTGVEILSPNSHGNEFYPGSVSSSSSSSTGNIGKKFRNYIRINSGHTKTQDRLRQLDFRRGLTKLQQKSGSITPVSPKNTITAVTKPHRRAFSVPFESQTQHLVENTNEGTHEANSQRQRKQRQNKSAQQKHSRHHKTFGKKGNANGSNKRSLSPMIGDIARRPISPDSNGDELFVSPRAYRALSPTSSDITGTRFTRLFQFQGSKVKLLERQQMLSPSDGEDAVPELAMETHRHYHTTKSHHISTSTLNYQLNALFRNNSSESLVPKINIQSSPDITSNTDMPDANKSTLRSNGSGAMLPTSFSEVTLNKLNKLQVTKFKPGSLSASASPAGSLMSCPSLSGHASVSREADSLLLSPADGDAEPASASSTKQRNVRNIFRKKANRSPRSSPLQQNKSIHNRSLLGNSSSHTTRDNIQLKKADFSDTSDSPHSFRNDANISAISRT